MTHYDDDDIIRRLIVKFRKNPQWKESTWTSVLNIFNRENDIFFYISRTILLYCLCFINPERLRYTSRYIIVSGNYSVCMYYKIWDNLTCYSLSSYGTAIFVDISYYLQYNVRYRLRFCIYKVFQFHIFTRLIYSYWYTHFFS